MKKIILLSTLFFSLLSIGKSFAWTYTVSANADAGAGTLRQAITDANNNTNSGVGTATPHIIRFTLASPYLINLNSDLPQINANPVGVQVIIDGTTHPNWVSVPLVIINRIGGPVGGSRGLYVNTGVRCDIKGIIIQNFETGIDYAGWSTGCIIQNNYFGLDATGSTKVGAALSGIGIWLETNCTGFTIGGTTPQTRNVISGCLNSNQNNGNRRGAITVGSPAGLANVGGCHGNTIIGNYIGLQANGTSATNVGNGLAEPLTQHGVYIYKSSTLANPVIIDQNVISNNAGNGVWVDGNGCIAVTITGNKIGTDASGSNPFGNKGGGIRVDGGSNHIIGGSTAASRNIISGNGGASDSRPCRSVYCGEPCTKATPPCYDKYDGTLQAGIYFTGVSSSTISGNYIGTDVTGNVTSAATSLTPYNGLGNLYAGIKIEGASANNTIGGATAASANVISGNGFDPSVTNPYKGHGIQLNTSGVSATTISFNNVGVGADGTTLIGNRQDGISLLGSSSNPNIRNNNVMGNTWGIFLQSEFNSGPTSNQSSNNTLTSNIIKFNGIRLIDTEGGGIGIQHGGSGNNVVSNTVTNNREGILIQFPSYGFGGPPSGNILTGNTISNNVNNGIWLNHTFNNTIGGVGAALLNTIQNNGDDGIELDSAVGNRILNNIIQSNTGEGIYIHNLSASNIIGGSAAEGNQILSNQKNGINIASGSNLNAINRNSISCNSLRGIELNGAGNNNYAKPTFTGSPTNFTLTGPAGSWIELYALDGCNNCTTVSNPKLQGKTLVVEGNSPLTYSPAGAYAGLTNVDFTATVSSAAPSLTNGATTAHNTSEFSACTTLCVTPAPGISVANATVCASTSSVVYTNTGFTTGNTNAWSVSSGASIVGSNTGTSVTINFGATGGTVTITLTETAGPGCFKTVTKDIIVNPVITSAAAGGDKNVCGGTTTLSGNVVNTAAGELGTWTVSPLTPGLSFVNANSPTTTVNGMAQGTTYTFTWTITNAPCSASSDNVIITDNPVITSAAAGGDKNVCGGTTTLSGNVVNTAAGELGTWTVSPLTPGLSFVNANSPTTTVNGMAQGTTYTFTWTITNAPCSASSDNVIITDNPVITSAAAGGDKNVCGGTTTLSGNVVNTAAGELGTWTVSPLTPGLSFVNANSPTTTVNGMAQGTTYTFTWTITNAPCSASSDDVIITDNPVITSAAAGADQSICTSTTVLAGNSANTAAGEVGTWTATPAGLSFGNINSPTSSVSGMVVGTSYTLTWTITNAPCSASSDNMTILRQSIAVPQVNITASSSSICTGTNVNFSISSITGEGTNPTYQWQLNGLNVGTNAATYSNSTLNNGDKVTLIITSSLSCANPNKDTSSAVVMTVFQNPVAAEAGPDQSLCGVSSATLGATAPSIGTGAWTVISGLASVTDPLLANSGVTGLGIGINKFKWTVTNGACASKEDSVTITNNPLPTVTTDVSTGQVCAGGSVTLTATGAGGTPNYTYAWSPAGTASPSDQATTIVTPTGNTTYSVSVTDSKGCTSASTADVVITFNLKPTVSASAASDSICSGTSTLLTATAANGTPNYSYVWTPSAGLNNAASATPTATPSSTTTYTVVVTDAKNCESTSFPVKVTVSETPLPPVVVAGDTTVFCTGGSVTLNVTPIISGLTYQWSNSSGLIPNATGPSYTTSTGGTYSVTGTSAVGCKSTSTANAVIVNLPVVSIDSARGSGSCAGVPVQLFSWPDPNGGSGSFTFHWTAIQDPTFNRTAQNPAFAAPGVSTDYIIVVQDANTNSPSCSAIDTVTILVASPFLNAGGKLPICAASPDMPVPATIINQTAPLYTWTQLSGSINYLSPMDILNPTITVPSSIAQPDTSTYKLTVIDNGCTVVDLFTLIFNPVPSITLSTSDTVVCGGSTAALNALIVKQTSPDYVYYWLQTKYLGVGPESDTLGRKLTSSTADVFSATAYPDSNFYHITVVDSKGCRGLSDTVQVKAYDKQNLVVPNLITPNNDHKNECFIIKDQNNFDILPGSSIEVYNSWGQAVFRAKNYSNNRPWCGGSLTDGVYYYYIKTGCGENEIKGWLHIMSNEANF